VLDTLCKRAASRAGVSLGEICSPTLRRAPLEARALLSHVAVRHYGFTLSTVARHLGLSINSIARAIERAAPLFASDDQLLEVLLVDRFPARLASERRRASGRLLAFDWSDSPLRVCEEIDLRGHACFDELSMSGVGD